MIGLLMALSAIAAADGHAPVDAEVEVLTDGRTRAHIYAYADDDRSLRPERITWSRPLAASDLTAFQTESMSAAYGLVYECRFERSGRLVNCRTYNREVVDEALSVHLDRLPDTLRLSSDFVRHHDPRRTWIYISLQVSSDIGQKGGYAPCIPPICAATPPPPPPPPPRPPSP